MIIRNYKLGKHIVPVLVELGTGDIEVINHHDPKDRTVMVSFTQGTKNTIGVETIFKEGTTSDSLEEIPVVLKFSHPDSIDSLIHQLQSSKSILINLKK
jgi:hypothetical protein